MLVARELSSSFSRRFGFHPDRKGRVGRSYALLVQGIHENLLPTKFIVHENSETTKGKRRSRGNFRGSASVCHETREYPRLIHHELYIEECMEPPITIQWPLQSTVVGQGGLAQVKTTGLLQYPWY